MTRSSITLNAKHKPKKCQMCGEIFIPLSGRAKRCEVCRRKWKKEYRRRVYHATKKQERPKTGVSKENENMRE